MIHLRDIFIKYGDRVLLDQINLTIGDQQRIAIVGNNGAGKSTLLKIIGQLLRPDSGLIEFEGNPDIGYLEQEIKILDRSVFDEAYSGLADINILDKKISDVTRSMEKEKDESTLLSLSQKLSELNEQYELIGGAALQAKVSKVLKGFGFSDTDFSKSMLEFSGGWQMRVFMTKLLLAEPEYLLLDEPTNYLDIESIIWLEKYLKRYPGTVILISHDKRFLDQVCNRTIEIVNGNVYDYPVGYSDFLIKKEERKAIQESAAKNQQAVIAQKERTITRFMAKASKTKMAQSMQKQLDKIERIEFDEEDHKEMRIQFLKANRLPREVVNLRNLSKAYGEKQVLEGIDFKLEREEKIAFVGQNGQGKTTLARIIAGNLDYNSGEKEIGSNVQLSYYAQDQTDYLDPTRTVLEEMEYDCPAKMRTKVRAILGAFLFSGEDVDKKVSVLSGGEKSRLAFAKMLLRPSNFLVLDEPTNHLDMRSKEILKQALNQFDNSLIIVSHDRDFLSGLTTKTIEFKDKKLHTYLGDINYFLEKRELNYLQDAALKTEASKPSAPNKKKPDRNQLKQLRRKVQYLERDIENLEEKIKEIEKDLMDPNFYKGPDSDKAISEYEFAKEELKVKMKEWEDLAINLESQENI